MNARDADTGSPRSPVAAGDAGAFPGLACGDDTVALCRERIGANLARIRLLLPVMAVLHGATAAVFSAVRMPPAGADPGTVEAWRLGLRLANGAMGGVAALLAALAWAAARRRRAGPPRWAGALPLATAFAYVLFAAWVTGIDQQITTGLTPFMVAVFAVALFVRVPAAASSAVYGAAWLALWVAMVCFQPAETLRLSAIVNGTTLAALGWALSLALDRGFVRDFTNRRIIDAQRTDLEHANERLGESLVALQRANAELVQEVRVRAAAETELARLATNDPLTNVANRRRFFEIAGIELERAKKVGACLTVAMIDVDHFKEINDRHGHAVGDDVLCAVAARCSAAMRGGDAIGRLGGDEFALLLVGVSLAETVTVAERMIEAVASVEVATRGGHVCPTVSIGVAEVSVSTADAVRVALERADEALYEAKRAGRGRVEVRTAPPRRL